MPVVCGQHGGPGARSQEETGIDGAAALLVRGRVDWNQESVQVLHDKGSLYSLRQSMRIPSPQLVRPMLLLAANSQ